MFSKNRLPIILAFSFVFFVASLTLFLGKDVNLNQVFAFNNKSVSKQVQIEDQKLVAQNTSDTKTNAPNNISTENFESDIAQPLVSSDLQNTSSSSVNSPNTINKNYATAVSSLDYQIQIAPSDIKTDATTNGWRLTTLGNATSSFIKVTDFTVPATFGPQSIKLNRAGGTGSNRSFLGYYESGKKLSDLQEFKWNRYSKTGTDTYLNIFLRNGVSSATVVYNPPATTLNSWQEYTFNSSTVGNLQIRTGGVTSNITFANLNSTYGNWIIVNNGSFLGSCFASCNGGITLVSGSSSPTLAQEHYFDKVSVSFANQDIKNFDFTSEIPILAFDGVKDQTNGTYNSAATTNACGSVNYSGFIAWKWSLTNPAAITATPVTYTYKIISGPTAVGFTATTQNTYYNGGIPQKGSYVVEVFGTDFDGNKSEVITCGVTYASQPVVTIDRAYAFPVTQNQACGIGSALNNDGLRVTVSNWLTGYKLQYISFANGNNANFDSESTWTDWGFNQPTINGTTATFEIPNSGNNSAGQAGWKARIFSTLNSSAVGNKDFIIYDIISDSNSKVCGAKTELEVCKVDTLGNKLSGWEINLGTPVGQIPSGSFNAASAAGSNVNLPAGTYKVQVSGTYRYGSAAMIADAGYSFRPIGIPQGNNDWVKGDDLGSPFQNYLKVQVNNQNIDWGSYNPDHVYFATIVHPGGNLNLKIVDNSYGDNASLNLAVNISQINSKTTGTSSIGCVIFTDLVPGQYALSETMQDNWKFLLRSDENLNGDLVSFPDYESITFTNEFVPLPQLQTKNISINEVIDNLPNLADFIASFTGQNQVCNYNPTTPANNLANPGNSVYNVNCSVQNELGKIVTGVATLTIVNSIPTNTVTDIATSLQANPVGGNPSYSYEWTGDCTGSSPSTTKPVLAGDYTCNVKVTDSDGDIVNTAYTFNIPNQTFSSSSSSQSQTSDSSSSLSSSQSSFSSSFSSSTTATSSAISSSVTNQTPVRTNPQTFTPQVITTDITEFSSSSDLSSSSSSISSSISSLSSSISSIPQINNQGQVLGVTENASCDVAKDFPWWLVIISALTAVLGLLFILGLVSSNIRLISILLSGISFAILAFFYLTKTGACKNDNTWWIVIILAIVNLVQALVAFLRKTPTEKDEA